MNLEKILAEKIREYRPTDTVDQENVLAELMQHYVLVGLARAGFFVEAEFHGGTFLRLIHGMDRFSEDLDFALKIQNRDFRWSAYLSEVARMLHSEGIAFEVVDKSNTTGAVRKAFMKTDAFGSMLAIALPHPRHPSRRIRIKLEVDTNPPAGSTFETSYLSFPVMTAITTQTLASAFASKSHALLCRGYAKGRDWYDFIWYVTRKLQPNYRLLQHALQQVGPWAGQLDLNITPRWYIERLHEAVAAIDWAEAAHDVHRFLRADQRPTLELWSARFFDHQIDMLERAV